eukprot:TRINITY_DN17752_c0_g1_i4.p1 TRINITY_DN17752_c0_g1~~TRINITY_DN17752_c0_g1_i4.p1  ORF type:complete len:111 (-),score=25.55 TRINITY_DN17752_c0_g1_i4:226-558(-)
MSSPDRLLQKCLLDHQINQTHPEMADQVNQVYMHAFGFGLGAGLLFNLYVAQVLISFAHHLVCEQRDVLPVWASTIEVAQPMTQMKDAKDPRETSKHQGLVVTTPSVPLK